MSRVEAYLSWAAELPRYPSEKRLMEIMARNPDGAHITSLCVLMQQPRRQVETLLHRLERQGVVRLVYVLDSDAPNFSEQLHKHKTKGHFVRIAANETRLWDLVKR